MPYTHLIKAISQVQSYLSAKRFVQMRKLADNFLDSALSQNDPLLIDLSLILYSLHKLCLKQEFKNKEKKELFLNQIESLLSESLTAVQSKNLNLAKKKLSKIFLIIEKYDSKLSYYMRNVIDKARIKYASKAYSKGMSLSKAVELTNADKTMVLDYIGATKAHEEYLKPGLFEKTKQLLSLLNQKQQIRIVCDSSTLISLSQSCQLFILRKLVKRGFVFYVSKKVVEEIISNPSNIHRFELSALRMKYALSKEYMETIEEPDGLDELSAKYNQICNKALFEKNKPLEVLQGAELEALALAEKIGSDFVAIDEFITRAFVEDPKKLIKVVSKRRGKHIKHNSNLYFLKDVYSIPIIRSADLVALAFIKGLLVDMEKKTLEASLYGVKFSGCAVASKEIDDFLKNYSSLLEN